MGSVQSGEVHPEDSAWAGSLWEQSQAEAYKALHHPLLVGCSAGLQGDEDSFRGYLSDEAKLLQAFLAAEGDTAIIDGGSHGSPGPLADASRLLRQALSIAATFHMGPSSAEGPVRKGCAEESSGKSAGKEQEGGRERFPGRLRQGDDALGAYYEFLRSFDESGEVAAAEGEAGAGASGGSALLLLAAWLPFLQLRVFISESLRRVKLEGEPVRSWLSAYGALEMARSLREVEGLFNALAAGERDASAGPRGGTSKVKAPLPFEEVYKTAVEHELAMMWRHTPRELEAASERPFSRRAAEALGAQVAHGGGAQAPVPVFVTDFDATCTVIDASGTLVDLAAEAAAAAVIEEEEDSDIDATAASPEAATVMRELQAVAAAGAVQSMWGDLVDRYFAGISAILDCQLAPLEASAEAHLLCRQVLGPQSLPSAAASFVYTGPRSGEGPGLDPDLRQLWAAKPPLTSCACCRKLPAVLPGVTLPWHRSAKIADLSTIATATAAKIDADALRGGAKEGGGGPTAAADCKENEGEEDAPFDSESRKRKKLGGPGGAAGGAGAAGAGAGGAGAAGMKTMTTARGGLPVGVSLDSLVVQLGVHEEVAVSGVEAAGVLAGITGAQIRKAAELVPFQRSCKRALRAIAGSGWPIHVLSANWSRDLIVGALPDLPEGHGRLFVHSNNLEFDARGVSTGRVEKRVETALDKGLLIDNLLHLLHSGPPPPPGAGAGAGITGSLLRRGLPVPQVGPAHDGRRGGAGGGGPPLPLFSVYLGDSATDLIALLAVDLGIVVGKSKNLRRVCAACNITLAPLVGASVAIASARLRGTTFSARGTGVLYEAASWEDIEACLVG